MTGLQHAPAFATATQHARRWASTRRHPPADAGELERLLASATFGEPTAWSTLVKRYRGRVRAVARRHRLAWDDVEDVEQTTWMRLLEHAGRIREPVALGAWLETTARREALRILEAGRQERPTEDVDRAESPAEYMPEPRPDLNWRAELQSALRSLPPRHRRLMAMLLADPAPSYAEISRTLEIPVGSIGPIRARSLERLRRDRRLVRVLQEEAA